MMRAIGLTSVGLAALFAGTSASAQTTVPAALPATASTDPVRSTTRTTTYDAAYFAQFAPRTALDIAQHVPGFQLDLGQQPVNDGRRRARICGNCGQCRLQRCAAEHQVGGARRNLQRIPAQQVVRVEVGPGDLYGSDYAGKSQVLNIILSQQGRVSTPMSRSRGSDATPATSTATFRLGVHPPRPVDASISPPERATTSNLRKAPTR